MKPYRQALQDVLNRRMSVNPRYSLRALARDLKISASFLSQVLGGKRGLTTAKAQDIFSALEFSTAEKKLFMLEVQMEQKRSDKKKAVVQKQIDSIAQQVGAHTFSTEQFDRMSQWYPMAILQLLRLKDAPKSGRKKFCEWTSHKLGLNLDLVESSVDAMIEMELIRETKGSLSAVHDTVWTTNQIPSGAIRTFHHQMIEKAKTAIEMQSIEERFLQSVQMPVLKSDLPQIQEDMVKFRNQLLRKYGRTSTGDADTVYGLNLQLFKLTEEKS